MATLRHYLLLTAIVCSDILFITNETLAKNKSKKIKVTNIPAQRYGPAGCGLGSVLLGANPSLLTQVPAYTTNTTYGLQTFGISSGTSNCNPTYLPIAIVHQQQFLQNNLLAVAKDAARGEGEFLSAYGSVFGCEKQDLQNFKKRVQQEYPNIFGQRGVEKILLATHVHMREVDGLAEGCEYVY